PGMTDEYVIVIAHTDGYYEAALDNASGLGVMVGLAEYYSKIPKAQRRRNMLFIATSGHHAGSPTTKWLHDNKATDELGKAALIVNCEHVSYTDMFLWNTHFRQTTVLEGARWWVNGSDLLTKIALDSWHEFGVSIVGDMAPGSEGDMAHI